MDAVRSSETLLDFYYATRRHIPKGSTLHTHHVENIISHTDFDLKHVQLRYTVLRALAATGV
jgi:hypothetical protein